MLILLKTFIACGDILTYICGRRYLLPMIKKFHKIALIENESCPKNWRMISTTFS